MGHLTDGQFGDYLNGELTDRERDRVEGHLEGCRSCREELDRLLWAERQFSEDLAGAGYPGEVGAEDLRPDGPAMARAGGRRPEDPSWRPRSARVLRAASVGFLLLITVAAGAATIPGSPLRPIAADLLSRGASLLGVGGASPDRIADKAFGVTVSPEEETLAIRLVDTESSTRVRIRMVDDSLIGIWAPEARLRFRSGRIEVRRPTSRIVALHLPRSLTRVRVHAEDRLLAIWDGNRVVPSVPVEDSGPGMYLISIPEAESVQ